MINLNGKFQYMNDAKSIFESDYTMDYYVYYGHDGIVGWHIDVFTDLEVDPILSFAQYQPVDPYETMDNLYREPIKMEYTGFNGRILSHMLMLMHLPKEFYYQIADMRRNPIPPIRWWDVMSNKKMAIPLVSKEMTGDDMMLGFKYVYVEGENPDDPY